MPWGAVAGAVVSYGLNSMGGQDKNGGAGTTTNSKEPWAAAQPWLMQNLQQGQALQNQYTAQPFNAQQQQAYANNYAQSDYMRSLVPSLLGQIQGQQVGFDRSNPTAKPTAFDWNAGLLSSGGGGGQGSMTGAQAAQDAADAAAAAAKKKTTSDFVQFNPGLANAGAASQLGGLLGGDTTSSFGMPVNQATQDLARQNFMPLAGGAGYGEFKYGQAMPERGTQAYRDMQEYLSYGGYDPFNLYGGGKGS